VKRARLLPPALAALALGTALALPGSAATGSGTRFDAPVLISKSQAARETSYAVDPTNDRRRFVCDPSGVPAVPDGQSYFHLSTDGGKKWAYEKVETSPTDTRSAAFEGGDCDVAFDRAGTMYSADTWLGDLSIGHSTDHGESWSGTAVSGTSPVVDRPWLVGGKKGELFVSYQDLQCCAPSAMWFMKSTDYGQTFTPAVPITTGDAGGLYTWEGNFVVSPDGKDLSLVYSRRMSGAVSVASFPETIWVTQSHDGGQTWTPHLVATLPVETTTIYPQIGLDAGGVQHVVWSAPGAKGNPVSYSFSRDHGLTWSRPVALNPGKVGWAPWVVGGKKAGTAAVVWLGSPDAKATSSTKSPWFFSWAKITDKGSAATWTTGNTTTTPLFEGKQVEPEFEMVSLDKAGKMHLGMSVYLQKTKTSAGWAVYSQDER
jgi:hypothetical protein